LLTRRQPPQSGGLPRRKTFFIILILCAPPKILLKKERKFFCSAPRSTRGRRDSMRTRQSKNYFCGRKRILLCLDSFCFGAGRSAAQEGAGGMRGGNLDGIERKIKFVL